MVGLPVEALRAAGAERFLGERVSITYAPSATVYTELVRRPRGAAGERALLLGDPPFNEDHRAQMERGELGAAASARDARSGRPGDLPRLPGSRAEVDGLAALFPESVRLLGADASEPRLEELLRSGELARFGTLHIATHALIDGERPERSSLVLSQLDVEEDPVAAVLAGERVRDGLLTVGEVLAEWRLDADLVTLSACDTGLGRAVGGEGYVGFAHAFLHAGARSLLLSLWEVDDRATSILMRAFYAARLGGAGRAPVDKAEALRVARRALADWEEPGGHRPYAHPSYWAAFVLVGAPR